MILFKHDMKRAILDGRKTVTRRQGKRRWKVGGEHLCYTRPPFARGGAEPFADVRILSVTREAYPGESIRRRYNSAGDAALLAENEAEGRREGFSGWSEFWEAYMEINGPEAYGQPCWRVEFELVEVIGADDRAGDRL